MLGSSLCLYVRFKLPDGLELANLRDLGKEYGEHEWSEERTASGFEASFSGQVDASLDWGIIPWLRGITKLPIFVKVISPSHYSSLLSKRRTVLRRVVVT